MNPYLSGIGLGLVLLASFVIMGRGLGVSGAMSAILTGLVDTATESHAQDIYFYSSKVANGQNPFTDWLVFEVLGLILGAFISAKLAGRIKKELVRGPSTTNKKRLVYAFTGGVLMGIGAMFARGCTSGQALTGGALLNLGSWAFMISIFIGGYAAAWFVRKEWL
ncbi:MAG: YeeE/YedE family protein [Calditrichaeota bacterium]|nr:YeeE/YedE family protein [Calditrichota bacterium]